MRRNIVVLSWFNFFIDFVFYAPVAVLYFAHVSGSYAWGMSIYSIIWIASALLEVPTGMFSDMIGRKNTVVLGAVSSLLSVIAYAIGGTYAVLVIGAIFEGLAKALFSGNNDALLHDSLREMGDQAAYHRFFGKLNGYNQIGLAIVVLTGGLLASISYSLVFWVSALPRVVLVILALFLKEPAVHGSRSTNIYAHLSESLYQFRRNRTMRLLAVAAAMRTAIYEGAYQFRTAFVATLWPLWAIGIANMISNICAAVSFFFSGKVIDRFGYKRVLVVEVIMNRITNLTALLFPTVFSPALMGTTSITYGVTTTAVNTLQQKEFSAKERATLGSLSSLFGSVLFSMVVVILGYLGDTIGPRKTLILSNVSILSILFVYKKIFTTAR
jgi:MFS family permease